MPFSTRKKETRDRLFFVRTYYIVYQVREFSVKKRQLILYFSNGTEWNMYKENGRFKFAEISTQASSWMPQLFPVLRLSLQPLTEHSSYTSIKNIVIVAAHK